jgi:acyl-CoA synthetase (AMP-forming)/AMP-acid ligase II
MTCSPDHSEFPTILQALQSHVVRQPNEIAYTFLESDDTRRTLTWQQLDQRARTIAAELLNHAVPGDRALLIYPPGLEFISGFLGCLYSGVVAVPAPPPRRNRKADRLSAITRDCNPRLLLASSSTIENIDTSSLQYNGVRNVILTDSCTIAVGETASDDRSLPHISGEATAFLQYTSGSTSLPKGVVISHSNLVSNEIAIQSAFGHDKSSVVCGWLPAFHDMGLIGIVLQPMFVGIHAILMSPVGFLSNPLRWLSAISQFRVTTSGGPNFAYDHCVNMISESDCSGLDLSSWSVAFNGSEPVRSRTLERFFKRFQKHGFRKESMFPCYGLAEATLFVSGSRLTDNPEADSVSEKIRQIEFTTDAATTVGEIVSCGTPAPNLDVVIVCPDTLRRLHDGSVGEIWIRGNSVSSGYWSDPDGNAAFCGIYTDQPDDIHFFRTGDLGYIRSNQIHVSGRLKDLIIIRGLNVYPNDIEAIVETIVAPGTSGGVAACGVLNSGEEEIAVVIEANREHLRLSRRSFDSEETFVAFQQSLAKVRHQVGEALGVKISHFAFLAPKDFPRTSSGKVRRSVCRDALQHARLEFLPLPGCITSVPLAATTIK